MPVLIEKRRLGVGDVILGFTMRVGGGEGGEGQNGFAQRGGEVRLFAQIDRLEGGGEGGDGAPRGGDGAEVGWARDVGSTWDAQATHPEGQVALAKGSEALR